MGSDPSSHRRSHIYGRIQTLSLLKPFFFSSPAAYVTAEKQKERAEARPYIARLVKAACEIE